VKTKVAESCAALIRSLPKEDHPKMIVTMQRQVLEPVNAALSGLTNTVIKGSNLLIPLRSLAKVPRLYHLMQQATTSQTHMINLYDDWLEQVSHVTAFFRLIIILRAMNINEVRAKKILQLENNEIIANHHLWPTYTPDSWLDVETNLKDLIIADYCRRNGVDVNRITPTEIRDILFGQEVGSAETLQQRSDTVKGTAEELEKYAELVKGDAPVETAMPATTRPWRESFLEAKARSRLPLVRVPKEGHHSGDTFSIPENLCQQFIQTASVPNRTVALLYGQKGVDGRMCVRGAVWPPQISWTDVKFPLRIPSHPLLDVFQPIGLLLTASDSFHAVSSMDQRLVSSFLEANKDRIPVDSPFLVIRMFEIQNRWTVSAFVAKDRAEESQEKPIRYQYASFHTVRSLKCAFYIPDDGIWNKTFDSVSLQENLSYFVKLGTPRPFYDPSHRSIHFRKTRIVR